MTPGVGTPSCVLLVGFDQGVPAFLQMAEEKFNAKL
jgi:hypothetical protein